MAEIKNITDKEGEVVYPVTKINAVYTQDNKRLDNVMLTVGDSVGSTDAVINAQTCGGVKLGIDGEGNRGYFKADDSFVPFNSSKIYTGTLATNGRSYITEDEGVELDYICGFQTNGGGTICYDKDYSTTNYKRNMSSGYSLPTIPSNTTTNDTLGKDGNKFYIYHSDMATSQYTFFAIGHKV